MLSKSTITLISALCMQSVSAGLGPQSGYDYCDTQSASELDTPVCDWDINITDFLTIFEEVDQGIFLMSTNYTIEDHHYDVEFFEEACQTAPSPEQFPISFYDQKNAPDSVNKINDVELIFM